MRTDRDVGPPQPYTYQQSKVHCGLFQKHESREKGRPSCQSQRFKRSLFSFIVQVLYYAWTLVRIRILRLANALMRNSLAPRWTAGKLRPRDLATITMKRINHGYCMYTCMPSSYYIPRQICVSDSSTDNTNLYFNFNSGVLDAPRRNIGWIIGNLTENVVFFLWQSLLCSWECLPFLQETDLLESLKTRPIERFQTLALAA